MATGLPPVASGLKYLKLHPIVDAERRLAQQFSEAEAPVRDSAPRRKSIRNVLAPRRHGIFFVMQEQQDSSARRDRLDDVRAVLLLRE